MTKHDTKAEERTDVDPRTHRAVTEHITLLEDAPEVTGADGMYLAVSHSGENHVVDVRGGACECSDWVYREPEGGCKHLRRAAIVRGEAEVPAAIDPDDIDPQLGIHIDDGVSTDDQAIAADGGTTVREAVEGAEILEDTPNHELEGVQGGTLVYEPVSEYSEILGRSTRVGRRLVGVTDVENWDAIRSELARLGHDVGAVHHLEVYDPSEVGVGGEKA
ncbi:hypothetical protein ACYJ1Y_16160 [Natrialbaceae archaeon A-gly3]